MIKENLAKRVKYSFFLFTTVSILISAPPTYALKPAKNDTVLNILFTANINGNIENCWCGENPLGGLDRIASIIQSWRQKDTPSLFIDGGDRLNTYRFPELNRTVLHIYKRLQPDLMILGDQEFVEGIDFLNTFITKDAPPNLASNIHYDGLQKLSVYRKKLDNRVSIQVLAYLAPESFNFIEKPKALNFKEAPFKNEYRRANEHDLNLLVYHGPEEALNKRLKLYPEFDCVLVAHKQRLAWQSEGGTARLYGGADGQHVNIVHVVRKIRGGETTFLFKRSVVPVSLDVRPQEAVEALILKFNKEHMDARTNE